MIEPNILLTTIMFYVFAGILIFSSLMVITAKNPVHSVLFLILAFFNASGLFILLSAEFIAMLTVIVYVGAVAVLFLFVVMMLNINFSSIQRNFIKYLPIGLVVSLIILTELIMVIKGALGNEKFISLTKLALDKNNLNNITNTKQIGLVLYTDYAYIFELAGLILLVAMVGAIVLTHRTRVGVLRQDISEQILRDGKKSLKIIKFVNNKPVNPEK